MDNITNLRDIYLEVPMPLSAAANIDVAIQEIKTLRRDKAHLEEKNKEIETLRSQVRELLDGKITMSKIIGDTEKDRDEWKRRAKELFMAAQNKSVDIPPEAAEWFKE